MKIDTRSIVISGLLIALSVVLTRIFKADMMIAGVQASRLSIGFVPIILAGIICGPVWGFFVGGLADSFGFLLFPSGLYYPLITLTSALAGLIPGLVVRYTGKTPDWAKALLSVSAMQVLCSMFLQTFFLSLLFGKAFQVLFVPRAIIALTMIPVYYVVVYAVLLGLKQAKLIPQRLGGASHR
jgi:ECF transporter S component (folate family)